MTRNELTAVLDAENYNAAATKVSTGGDPVTVLSELRPLVAQETWESRERVALLLAVVHGEEPVL